MCISCAANIYDGKCTQYVKTIILHIPNRFIYNSKYINNNGKSICEYLNNTNNRKRKLHSINMDLGVSQKERFSEISTNLDRYKI